MNKLEKPCHIALWLWHQFPQYRQGIEIFCLPNKNRWSLHLCSRLPRLFPHPVYPLMEWYVQSSQQVIRAVILTASSGVPRDLAGNRPWCQPWWRLIPPHPAQRIFFLLPLVYPLHVNLFGGRREAHKIGCTVALWQWGRSFDSRIKNMLEK